MDEGTEVQQITCWAQGCHRVGKWQSRDLNLNLSSCFLASTSKSCLLYPFQRNSAAEYYRKTIFFGEMKIFPRMDNDSLQFEI